MKIYIKLLLMPLLAWSTYNYAETLAPILNQEMQHIDGHAIQAGRDVTINYQKSEDYQDLMRQRDSSLEDVQMYPENTKFAVELAEVEKKIAAFERDVLQLAATIKSISRNSKRLEQATAYFEAGEFDKARVVLDIEEITKEQESLLQQKDALQKELETNADELILLAQATAINYELGEQRIPQTKAYFEQALVSDRSGDNLFRYASFLQDNNQFQLADQYYSEALKIYRALAKGNPSVYEPDVALTLNNLALLVSVDTQRRAEAETLYNEALGLRRALAKVNSSVYESDVAGTLNNLALLVSVDTQRRAEAETLYTEALGYYRALAKVNPSVYESYVAITLNNLALLVDDDTQRRAEAETLYTEALELRRALARGNPSVYEPDLVDALGAYGLAHLNWNDNEKAAPLLKEASELLAPLAKQYPSIYGDKQAYILYLSVKATPQDELYICQAMQEVVEVVRTMEDLTQMAINVVGACKEVGILQ